MKTLLTVLCAFVITAGFAQEKIPAKFSKRAHLIRVTEPLRDYALVKDTVFDPLTVAKIRNNLKNAPKVNPNALPLNGDPVRQINTPARAPQDEITSFDGMTIFEGQANPPDPTGAAGPNHYVHATNSSLKVFSPNGTLLLGPVRLGDFFQNGINDGDPIVMYDQLADRWFISQFYDVDNALLIAISQTPDPTGSYNMYQFDLDSFPDYPHYAIWPDGYYLAANKSGDAAYVLDRVAMLAGDTDPEVLGFSLPGLIRNPNTVLGIQGANLVGPTAPAAGAPGYFVYLQDDAWGGVAFDHLKIWKVEPNFDNGNNGTISTAQVIPTAPFTSTFQPFGTGDVFQPGTTQKIDNIGGVISYMTNFRVFASHNSMVLNFNVNVTDDVSGIRWYELRNTGTGDFSIYQEGTWTLADPVSRFLGTIGINKFGDIALGYNAANSQTPVDIRFTGRLANDPLNEMSFQETIVEESDGVATNSSRFGDYAHMTMDSDDESFWFVSEYFDEDNEWITKITHFDLDGLPLLSNIVPATDEASIAIFPLDNSTHKVVFSTEKELSNLTYDILDIKGKRLFSGKLDAESNGYNATFNTTALSSGVYLVELKDNASFKVIKKFVIN